MSNSLDPDQDQHFVVPDLGTNCLQRLSADDIGRRIVYSFRNISRLIIISSHMSDNSLLLHSILNINEGAFLCYLSCADPEGVGAGGPDPPPEKSQKI